MTDFKKTLPAGRMIARLFAQVGWGIAIVGLVLACAGLALGAIPGAGDAPETVSAVGRVIAAMPGVAVALFGLFCVLMAAQTRAAIDSADIAREMLVLARRRPISLLAAIPTLDGASDTPAAPARTAQGDDTPEDEVPPMPVNPLRSRVRTVSKDEPRGAARDEPDTEPRKQPRAEPVFAANSRPRPAPGKMHPIFSARPPR